MTEWRGFIIEPETDPWELKCGNTHRAVDKTEEERVFHGSEEALREKIDDWWITVLTNHNKTLRNVCRKFMVVAAESKGIIEFCEDI